MKGFYYMARWEDLYKILQVHYDAEQEVIEGAYKKLCKKYHPDINKSTYAQEKIKMINVAYETLRDPQKRKQFHSEWLNRNRYFNTTNYHKENQWKSGFDSNIEDEAQEVLNNYLIALSQFKYREAFELLTDSNKQTIECSDFLEWQEAVSQLYSIGNFRTKLFKKGINKKLSGVLFLKYIEFEIDASEKNLMTGVVSSYHFTKIIVFENNQWKIFLEYTDLKYLIYKFKFLYYAKDKGNLINYFAEFQVKKDQVSGLLNKRGFTEELEKENSRFLRYKSTFSIVVFSISQENDSEPDYLEKEKVEWCAFFLKNNIRSTDVVAHLGNGIFALILIETDYEHAEIACNKFEALLRKAIHKHFGMNFIISYGIHEHNGREVMDSFYMAYKKAGLSKEDPAAATDSLDQKSILF